MKKIMSFVFVLLNGYCLAGGYFAGPEKYVFSLKSQVETYQLTESDIKWKDKVIASKLGQKAIVKNGCTPKVFVTSNQKCLCLTREGEKVSFPVFVNLDVPGEFLVQNYEGSSFQKKADFKDDIYFFIDSNRQKIFDAGPYFTFRHSKGKVVLLLLESPKTLFYADVGKYCHDAEVSFVNQQITWRRCLMAK